MLKLKIKRRIYFITNLILCIKCIKVIQFNSIQWKNLKMETTTTTTNNDSNNININQFAHRNVKCMHFDIYLQFIYKSHQLYRVVLLHSHFHWNHLPFRVPEYHHQIDIDEYESLKAFCCLCAHCTYQPIDANQLCFDVALLPVHVQFYSTCDGNANAYGQFVKCITSNM